LSRCENACGGAATEAFKFLPDRFVDAIDLGAQRRRIEIRAVAFAANPDVRRADTGLQMAITARLRTIDLDQYDRVPVDV
jgi:hypothetical protein